MLLDQDEKLEVLQERIKIEDVSDFPLDEETTDEYLIPIKDHEKAESYTCFCNKQIYICLSENYNKAYEQASDINGNSTVISL